MGKGREFDFVYVVGLAEDIMPSFQSKKKGDQSAEMEEERRNCFVAITRTKECLVLSRGKSYRAGKRSLPAFLLRWGWFVPMGTNSLSIGVDASNHSRFHA